jgi:hypothetical protein
MIRIRRRFGSAGWHLLTTARAHSRQTPAGGYFLLVRWPRLVVIAAIGSGCGARPASPTAAPTSDLDGAAPDGAAPDAPTGSLAGSVRDVATGETVAFAAIEAVAVCEGEGWGSRERALRARGHPEPEDNCGRRAVDTSGAAGEFNLTLPPGRYRLTAAFGDLRAELPDVVVMERRVTRIYIDLDSRPALAGPRGDGAIAAEATGEIAGQITEGVGASATPFAGAVISAMAPGVANAPMAMSDQRGRYRLRGLRPGRYDLTVYYQLVDRGAIELRRTDIEVRAGRATHVDLELDLRTQ